jgi:hypothetical protein
MGLWCERTRAGSIHSSKGYKASDVWWNDDNGMEKHEEPYSIVKYRVRLWIMLCTLAMAVRWCRSSIIFALLLWSRSRDES